MHRGVLACALKLGVLVVGLGAAGQAETVTIATYNVENYGPANRVTPDGFRSDYPKPEREKQALRTVIEALHADVLVVQEMGGEPYLFELARDLRAEGCDYPFTYLARGSDEERHVAVLSKLRVSRAETLNPSFAYFGAVAKVKRGVLEVVVETQSGPITIFGVHLKSRLTERADDPECAIRRAGEATAIRDSILRQFADPSTARFVVVGDCNDSKASKAIQHLLRRGMTTVAVLLSESDSRGEHWTYSYGREDAYERFDHVMVSPTMQPWVVDAAAMIYDGPGVLEASDHRPVVAKFELKSR